MDMEVVKVQMEGSYPANTSLTQPLLLYILCACIQYVHMCIHTQSVGCYRKEGCRGENQELVLPLSVVVGLQDLRLLLTGFGLGVCVCVCVRVCVREG